MTEATVCQLKCFLIANETSFLVGAAQLLGRRAVCSFPVILYIVLFPFLSSFHYVFPTPAFSPSLTCLVFVSSRLLCISPQTAYLRCLQDDTRLSLTEENLTCPTFVLGNFRCCLLSLKQVVIIIHLHIMMFQNCSFSPPRSVHNQIITHSDSTFCDYCLKVYK